MTHGQAFSCPLFYERRFFIMTYPEAVEFMQSTRFLGSVPGLSRLQALLARLGNPERQCRFIHVAGTNGKGSVCKMLSSVLCQAGYRTGLYTSPYLHSVREQIQVNGKEIDREAYIRLAEKLAGCGLNKDALPTEFELNTALAFLYFAEQKCEVVVLEAGMGGALDATNVIPAPMVAVLTPISRDHTSFLGETLGQIAAQKAGIIKPGCRVISAPQDEAVQHEIEAACQAQNVPCTTTTPSLLNRKNFSLSGQRFYYGLQGPYFLPLLGRHQLENAALVLQTVLCLKEMGFRIPDQSITAGLAEAHWPARLEILGRPPLFILDGAHNTAGMQSAIACLKELCPDRSFVFLTGVMRDKSYEQMFSEMAPLAAQFIGVQPENPRALPLSEMEQALLQTGRPAMVCDTVQEGVKAAIQAAKEHNAGVCAIGSLYMADDVRKAALPLL